jgi:dTDP-glucose 4,6-dehydratase
VERFHQISTGEVYGDLALDDPGALSETSPYRPRTPYNAAKAGGDHAVRAYFHTHDLPVTITNCSNNYGPYQFPEKVIPLFITRALQGQPLPLYASTRNRREWLHVLDHCRAIDLVLERGTVGETYHVGSRFEANIETIADTVLAELGLPASLKTIVPDRPSRDRALPPGLQQAPEGAGLGARGAVPGGHESHRRLVPRQPVMVAAAPRPAPVRHCRPGAVEEHSGVERSGY